MATITMTPKEKLQSIIDESKDKVEETKQSMMQEFSIRRDLIMKPRNLDYEVRGNVIRPVLRVKSLDEFTSLTNHSRAQLLTSLKIPAAYADHLIAQKEHRLLRENLLRMTERMVPDGMMFRNVGPLTKGIMSPSYRRMDASPIFDTFINKCLTAGFIPLRGNNTDYRYQLTFLWPHLFEIAPNEYVVYTVQITTSDYGSGKLRLDLGVLRVWCANLATGFDIFSKIHLGRRFEVDDQVGFAVLSNETHELDTKTIASAISDGVGKAGDMVPILNEKIVAKAEEKIDAKGALARFQKQFGKEITKQVEALYNADVDTIELPQVGGTAWKMSNVLSLVAKKQPDDVRLDMEREAYDFLIEGKKAA